MEPTEFTTAQITMGIIATLLSGGAITKLFEFLVRRQDRYINTEAKLWQEIGTLKAKLAELEEQLKEKNERNYYLVNVNHSLQLEKIVLQIEVNDLLEELGREPRYKIAVEKYIRLRAQTDENKHNPVLDDADDV